MPGSNAYVRKVPLLAVLFERRYAKVRTLVGVPGVRVAWEEYLSTFLKPPVGKVFMARYLFRDAGYKRQRGFTLITSRVKLREVLASSCTHLAFFYIPAHFVEFNYEDVPAPKAFTAHRIPPRPDYDPC